MLAQAGGILSEAKSFTAGSYAAGDAKGAANDTSSDYGETQSQPSARQKFADRWAKWLADDAFDKEGEYASMKAAPVLGEDEIGRMTDLGLGRGIDATLSTPWLNKTSFQVRVITADNIIGTEEGGALQNYEREITSAYATQTSMKASITIPKSPVTIGMDAEGSRSMTSTRRSVGKKLVTRTISFRADFHDAPTMSSTCDASIARQQSMSLSRRSKSENKQLTFEERLCSWILERIANREELTKLQASPSTPSSTPSANRKVSAVYFHGANPVAELADYIRDCTHEERKQVVQDCRDFVNHFHITHYVSAIELGASEYRVMSETEYNNQIGAAGSFGVQSIANAAVSEKISWKKRKQASELKKIGIIRKDGTVCRGSYGEAVVGIQMLPISGLVSLRYLQMAMQQALVTYVNKRANSNLGPFLIACGDNEIFLTVDSERDYVVEGTRDVRKATEFFIIPNDGHRPYEFLIACFKPKPIKPKASEGKHSPVTRNSTLTNTSTEMSPFYYYLNSHVSMSGKNPGPLKMQLDVTEKDSRLTLHSRLRSSSTTIETTSWVNGKEMYYINCNRRRFKRNGYICLQQRSKFGRKNRAEFKTACVPSVSHHNNHSAFMLFRLLPAKIRDEAPRVIGAKSTGATATAGLEEFADLEAELDEQNED